MNGTFAQGNPYNAPQSGVGAYIPNGEEYAKPTKAFVDTYDTINTWRRQKEADQAKRAAYVKADIDKFNLNTTGIRPAAYEPLMEARNEIIADYTQALQEVGGNTSDPRYVARLSELQGKMGALQIMADSEVSANKLANEYIGANLKQPDLYSPESRKKIEDFLNAPDTKSAVQLASRFDMPRQKGLEEILNDITDKGKPNIESGVGSGGLIQETSTFGKKINPKTGAIENDDDFWLSKYDDPLVKDATMQQMSPVVEQAYMQLPDPSTPEYAQLKSQKDAAQGRVRAVEQYVDNYNKLNPTKPISLDEGWFLSKANPHGYYQRKSEGQDAYYKASAHAWGVGEAEAKKLGDNNWKLANVLNGSDDFYELVVDETGKPILDANGNRVFQTNMYLTDKLGSFDKKVEVLYDDGTKKIETVKSDNYLIEPIQRIEGTDGKPIFRYKTTYTENIGNDPNQRIKNGWKETTNPADIVQIAGDSQNASSGLNGAKYERIFADWTKSPDGSKEKSFWNENNKTYDLNKLRQIIPVKNKPHVLSKTEPKTNTQVEQGGVQKKYNAGGKSYSEKELIDLGYTKEQIEEAVKLGNVTIE